MRLLITILTCLISLSIQCQDLTSVEKLYTKGEFKKARTLYPSNALSSNLEISRKHGDLIATKDILWSLTTQNINTNGEIDSTSINYFNQLALLEWKLEQFQLAEKISKKAHENSLKLYHERHPSQAFYHLIQGKNALFTNQYSKAEASFDLAEQIIIKSDTYIPFYSFELYLSKSELYFELGQYNAAEVLLIQLKKLLDSHPNHLYEGYYHLALSNIYIALNNFEDAKVHFEELTTLINNNFTYNHYLNGQLYASKANASLLTNNLESTLQNIKNAERLTILTHQKINRHSLKNKIIKSEYFLKSNLPDSAFHTLKTILKNYQESLNNRPITTCKIEFDLAITYSKKENYKKAIQLLKSIKNKEIDHLDKLHPLYHKTIQQLAITYWKDKNYQQAKHYFLLANREQYIDYNRTFSFLSEKEKELYYDQIKKYYNQFYAFALEQHKNYPSLIDELYNTTLTTKGLLFQQSAELKSKISNSSDEVIQAYSSWIQLREKIATAEKFNKKTLHKNNIKLDSLKAKSDRLEKLLSIHVEFFGQNELSKTKTWYDIKPKINKDEASIEVVRIKTSSDSVTYAFLVLNHKLQRHPDIITISGGKELENKFYYYYKNCIQLKLLDQYSFDAYWKPLNDYLKEKELTKVYFSPDGIYHQVNLNTIYNTKKEEYLVDEFDFHYLNNTYDLTKVSHIKNEINEESITYLFGFPDFGKDLQDTVHHEHRVNNHQTQVADRGVRAFRGTISDLPGTKKEIDHIDSVFKKEELTVNAYMDDYATEKRIKSIVSPTILHIATHGFFDDKNLNKNVLLSSGLLLSGAQHAYNKKNLILEIQSLQKDKSFEDGILTSYEAQNINLQNTSLVVLSACETGKGVFKDGEGVYGLKRSFQTAGAKTVIMSLWKVDDDATQYFMNTFYDIYLTTQDKHYAFLESQKMTKEKYQYPFFWGAFIMTGD